MYKKAVFLILFCVTACGHTGREHARIIELVRQGNLAEARQLAEKKISMRTNRLCWRVIWKSARFII